MTSSSPGVRRFHVTETREVMEVRVDNLEEAARWCRGSAVRCTSPRHADTPSDYIEYERRSWDPDVSNPYGYASVGDVLVTDGSRWWDVSREEFERASAQWTEET